MMGFNFTCTNVPGPTWTQYLCGKEIIETTGTLMLSGNLGFGVSVGSMAGRLYFNFTSDPRLLGELSKVADFVDEAVRELQQLVESEQN